MSTHHRRRVTKKSPATRPRAVSPRAAGRESGKGIRTILILTSLTALLGTAASTAVGDAAIDFRALRSPVLFRGDAATAYRDPTAIYEKGTLYLYFTMVKTERDGRVYSYTAWSKSRDLLHWSAPSIITPRDRSLNFSSPGNVVRFGGEWILCLQTYPRPNGEKYGNADARPWIRRSRDLEHWGEPELLRVKGPGVPAAAMGRIIDPYLVADKDEPGKWWCFFDDDAANMAWSLDLRTWTYFGRTPAGENPCVLVDGGDYVLFHSPKNGIGMKRSPDMKDWRDDGALITLGQRDWSWAAGRLTAGFVLDGRRVPGLGRFVMFFHGSEFPENDPRGGFDTFASIGIAWSDDLRTWSWPGKFPGAE